jgi:glycosyltransferase involved in cell wall biosynthesis
MDLTTSVSIVIPVYRAEGFLHKTLEAIELARKEHNWNLELVLVEDGSPDHSWEKIMELAQQYPYIKALKLSRNFGHQIAVRTGLEFASNEYVAILDDDLQDPPSLLPLFFQYLNQGFDVAYGVRKKRKENWIKRLSYNAFYRILQKLSGINIPLDSGDFCVMKRKVVLEMLRLPEQNPFLRGIRAWVGFKQMGVTYERHARIEGESGYTLSKLLKIAGDGIFSFSSLPLRLITILGFIGLTTALGFSFFSLIKYFSVGINSPGYTSLVILIAFFFSITLISLGIIGEYIARIYDEVRKRPHAHIEMIYQTPEPI